MSNLTPAQIGAYAAGAGFSGTGLRNAIAVALAESGGNPRAVHTNADRYRSRDRGLWQINDHWHPEVSDAAAFDPARAAAAAYRISARGTNFNAWSTWKNGSAQAQFGRAQLGANQSGSTVVNAGFPTPNLPNGLDPFLGIPGLLDLFGGKDGMAGGVKAAFVLAVHAGIWIADPHNWQRVAMVVAGSGGILLGLSMVAKSGAAGSTAQEIAAIPGKATGAVVKGAGAVATDGASLAVK